MNYYKINYISDPAQEVVEINNGKLVLLFDGVHLIKSNRNNLATKHMQVGCKEAMKNKSLSRKYVKWKYFQKAYDMDVNSIQLFLKHTKDYFEPRKDRSNSENESFSRHSSFQQKYGKAHLQHGEL